jgi:hypothetical protein
MSLENNFKLLKLIYFDVANKFISFINEFKMF